MRSICAGVTILLFALRPHASGQLPQSKTSGKPPTLAQLWTLDATYRDRAHGVTFRYPSVWKSARQFGYIAPAIDELTDAHIAGFGFNVFEHAREQGVPYASSDLEGFGVVYAAVSAANEASCEKRAASLFVSSGHHATMIGGRTFMVFETGESGMSQSARGSLYVTYASQTCYFVETNSAWISRGVDDDVTSALTPAQERFIDQQLLKIVRTVRIVPNR
jgi:hypothetical protein